ncbi:MAG: DUF4340 domain-containing protein [Candidatus Methylomirabilia bacterium]
MRWTSTVALALIFSALAGFYYVYEIRLGPEREKAERLKDRLWTVEPKAAEELVVTRQAGTLRLAREGDGWVLLEPLRARADKSSVEDFVTNLLTAKVERKINSDPASLADFGLDRPAAEIAVRVKGETAPLTLLLGDKNPTRLRVYAKEKERPAVFLLSDFLLQSATKPVDDFRDKTVLAFDRQDVSQLEISYHGQLLSAVRGEEPTRWKVIKPRAYRADWGRLADFMDKLRFARIMEFVAEAPTSLGRYGLDRPTRVTLWIGTEEDRTAKTLLLGKLSPERTGFYAKRPGEPTVFLVGKDVWAMLPKSVNDLRDKTVFEYERSKVVRLELESPNGRVVLAKEGEQWQITKPESLKADDSEVSGLLWTLKDLRAESFVAEGAAAVRRYLARPDVKIAVWEEGDQAPKIVLLARAPGRRAGKALAYAAVAGQDSVLLVKREALEELTRSVTDLRDRTLLGGFDPSDVKRFQVKRGEQVMLVERRSETDWRILEPEPGKAREAKVSDFLFTLTTLKWEELVSPKAPDAAQYGLDDPSVELTLWGADGSEIGTLIVGKTEADKTYLKTNASPAVYAVKSRALGALPSAPEDFSS